MFDYPFVEPTGRFSGSEEQRADYYVMTCAGFAALCIVRAVLVTWGLVLQAPRRPRQAHPPAPVQLMTWALLAALVALVYSANFLGAFFMVGVHPTIMLPLGLNAPIAFMVFIGTPLLCACIVAQDLAARRRLTMGALLFLCVASFIASLSMASRGAIVVHLVPVLAASMVVEGRFGNGRSTIAKLGLAAAFLLSVIVAVALYRISLYYGKDWSDSDLLAKLVTENALLFVDRWIGLESMLVAVSEPRKSMELFWAFLAEDPTAGVLGLYQVLAGAGYVVTDGRTYLTLPGFMAILAMSGSATVVALGSAAVMVMLAGLESILRFIYRGSELPVALASGGLAYVIFQMSYPRLLIPFLIQLIGFSAIFAFVTRSRVGRQP